MESNSGKDKVEVKPYKDMPRVELTGSDKIAVRLELNESLSKKIVDVAKKGPIAISGMRGCVVDSAIPSKISISLESLDLDLQHNQSFGMICASTGCASNPGGPGC